MVQARKDLLLVHLKKNFNLSLQYTFCEANGFTFFLPTYGLYQATIRFCTTYRQTPTPHLYRIPRPQLWHFISHHLC